MSSVRWKLRDYEVEVEGDDAFIEKHLARFEQKLISHTDTRESDSAKRKQEDASLPDGDLAPAEYVRHTGPEGGTQTLLVLAKYLHDYKTKKTFSRADLRGISAEARIKDIHPQYYSLALDKGYLREVGKEFALTLSGEDLVVGLIKSKKAKSDRGDK
jgi:hypothetical protein